MKKLSNKELKKINGGDFWEDLGTITGNVINKIARLGKGKK
ncbi:hypothetical protein DOS77_00890 [Staphylococcus felis]|nr:bacteriocin [Staphylococcus felis]REH94398.1 hypothetical protein DOS67_09145 [Staphylococcus felis]REI04510.1 hypothetical protein DOS62_05550 [Staphylococcus felis]REI25387.1 hypothetical protein DOS77_00890 [Staphylococcus felis]REI32363.1 hypothetical protein DOS82_10525 [Staphylococcus felis]